MCLEINNSFCMQVLFYFFFGGGGGGGEYHQAIDTIIDLGLSQYSLHFCNKFQSHFGKLCRESPRSSIVSHGCMTLKLEYITKLVKR